ncbi:MAG: nucleoside transporter C-terminal domain-containing protein [Steroidobacteraceae bacterium]
MTAWLGHLQGVLGIAAIVGLCWAVSENRRGMPSWRWLGTALLIQLVVAVTLLRIPAMFEVLRFGNTAVDALARASRAGSAYMFGYLGGADLPFDLRDGGGRPVIIAFEILPLVIVTSALAALLWHWGILRAIVRVLSYAMQRSMQIGGAVGLNAGANLFLGVIEAPLVVRAYLERMTRSELFMVMTLGMSTVSGVVLVLYSQTLAQVVDNAFAHILTASLISMPAAVLLARVMVPGSSPTGADRPADELRYESSIDALVRGTGDGLKLFLMVIAMLIVIFACVSLCDQLLEQLPNLGHTALTLKRVFGWLFAPLMWAIGIDWQDAAMAGSLMGTKAVLNEYVAYLELAAAGQGAMTPRSTLICTYALCGFANFASIGLLISAIVTLAPSRRRDAVQLGMRSWLAGNLASAMTGAMVGMVLA